MSVSTVWSQDLIWLKDGRKLNVKVVSQDTSVVVFEMRQNGFIKTTYIDKPSIARMRIQDPSSQRIESATIGFGAGLNYGGYGGTLILADHNVGVFAGFGYALAGAGYNFGLKIKLTGPNPPTHIFPYLIGMYGYNSAIAIMNAKQYSKFFYGPTFGLGLDVRKRWERRGYLSMAILLPVRSKDVNKYINDMKRRGVDFENQLYPVGISVGYHIIMNQ
jgi:hypothetical protein